MPNGNTPLSDSDLNKNQFQALTTANNRRLRRKAAIFLLAMPLLTLLFPMLQIWRVQDTERVNQSYLRYVEARQNNQRTVVPYGISKLPLDARPAAAQQYLEMQEAYAGSFAARKALAWASLGIGVAAVALGALLLLRVRRTGHRALRDYDYLVSHFDATWRTASRLLMLQLAAMLAVLTCNVLFEVLWTREHWSTHGFMALLMALPLFGGMVTLSMILVRTRRALGDQAEMVLPVLGRPLSRQDAPALWQWLDGVARRIDAPTPDHVAIGLAEGFYVTSAPVQLMPQNVRLTGRTLHIPLTFAATLSQQETEAIIGHELGHFAHGDTENGTQLAVVHRTMHQRVEQLIEEVERNDAWLTQPPLWTSLFILSTFDHAYAHWSRRQELAADAASVRAVGAEAAARALIRVTAIDAVLAKITSGTGTPNLIATLHTRLADEDLVLDDAILARTLPHPIDSHPPARARLDALGVRLDDALIRTALRKPDSHDHQWFAGLITPAPARAS